MSNDINGVSTSLVQSTGGLAKSSDPTTTLDSPQRKQGSESSDATTQDHLTLTASATKLRQLEKDIAALPVVDQQRVDSIKNAILNGEYTIDPVKTAEKFIHLEMALAK
jgi:negative regulator of flagellin synthesis FlgM